MPKQTPSASEYTANVKSAASANDLASKPTGSVAAARATKAVTTVNRGTASLGRLSAIVTQSAIAKAIIPRPITTSSVPLLISETGLVLWLDAANLSSIVFSDTVTFGAGTYQRISSIKDSYKGIIASSKTTNYQDPIYVPSVNSTFLTHTGLTHPNATNKPAFYFRGRDRGTTSRSSHTWTLNQLGNPLTMFVVWQAVVPGSGGVAFSSSYSDSALIGYGYAYDTSFFASRMSENIDIRQKSYSSYNTPVIQTLANRVSGSTKQILLRFNGSQVGSNTVTTWNGNEWYHNPPALLSGRGNGEMAETLVHEVILYNTLMTDSEIQAIENYLKAKWGL